ncbi:MAG: hypothetical protein WCH99_04885 [Verrucomicrobiota bacterium]
MSANNTPRADAVLKNLSKERQHEVWLRRTEGEESQRSLAALCKWLREDGIKATPRMLSEFLSWYSARLDLQATGDLIETFEEFTRKRNPDWSAEKVRDVAVQFLMAHTASNRDVNKFVSVGLMEQNERFGRTKAAFKERELALKEEKSAEEKKSNQQKALEYCLAEAKGTPAEELFAQAFVALKKVRNAK